MMRRRRSEGFRIMCVFSKPKGRGRKTISEGSRAHLTRASSALSFARVNLGSCRASVGGVGGGVGARDPDPVSKSRSKSNVASSTSTSIASSILFLPEAGDAGASRGASANDAFVAVVRAGHSRGGDCSGDVLRRPGNVAVPGCGSSVVVIASPRARRMWIFQITRCARF
jgi:hypothetical protein